MTEAVRGADVVFHIASYGMSGAESLRADVIYRVNVSVGGVGGVDADAVVPPNVMCAGEVDATSNAEVFSGRRGPRSREGAWTTNTCNPAFSFLPCPLLPVPTTPQLSVNDLGLTPLPLHYFFPY